MKQPHERGEIGAWLVEQRKRLGEDRGVRLTQQMVVDELRAEGETLDSSYYRALESGAKTPGPEMRAVLARYYGRTPPTVGRRGGSDETARIVAAIEAQTDRIIQAQTDAVNRLIAALSGEGGFPAQVADRLATRLGLPRSPDAEDAHEGTSAPPGSADIEPQPSA